nr:MAG TPA: hypothetical protein [Caudoviricetes sp.]
MNLILFITNIILAQRLFCINRPSLLAEILTSHFLLETKCYFHTLYL